MGSRASANKHPPPPQTNAPKTKTRHPSNEPPSIRAGAALARVPRACARPGEELRRGPRPGLVRVPIAPRRVMRDAGRRENDDEARREGRNHRAKKRVPTTRAASRFSRCLINSSSRGQKCTAKYAEFSCPSKTVRPRVVRALFRLARARRSTPRSGWPKAPTTRRTTSLTRTTGTVSDVDVRGARKASRRGPRCIATVPGKSHRSASRRRPRGARTRRRCARSPRWHDPIARGHASAASPPRARRLHARVRRVRASRSPRSR